MPRVTNALRIFDFAAITDVKPFLYADREGRKSSKLSHMKRDLNFFNETQLLAVYILYCLISLLRSRSLSRHATLLPTRSVAWREKERLRRRLVSYQNFFRYLFVLTIFFFAGETRRALALALAGFYRSRFTLVKKNWARLVGRNISRLNQVKQYISRFFGVFFSFFSVPSATHPRPSVIVTWISSIEKKFSLASINNFNDYVACILSCSLIRYHLLFCSTKTG